VTVSFFVLVAYKRDNPKSVEAGLKLLIIGSISAAMLLYGIAFIYGATGTVFFADLRAIVDAPSFLLSTELLIGLFLVFLGLGFKTSAVPMHVWVPDVYEGAPTPVTAYLSVGSKLAGFVLMLRVLEVFGRSGIVADELTPFLALVAALTLFYGNLGAIPQTNIKRLMGYSSIGQCGYILLGVAAAWEAGMSGALFYMTAYVFTNLTVFAVIVYVARATKSHDLDDYSGLARRNPLLGAALTVGLLSLAGVPPILGFVGKFFVLGAAFGKPELRWLVYCGLINVVIGLYYYLCVIKRMWIKDARNPAEPIVPKRVKVALVVSLIVLVAGGLAPQLVEKMTAPAAAELGLPKTPR
jgi:NADH-quinone oxidoreductase subunit N